MKLSQWHDISIDPVHVGVYEADPDEDGQRFFSYWDGQKFRGQWADIEEAFYKKNFDGEATPLKAWRGIVK